MGKLLSKPKVLTALVAIGVLIIMGLAGGPLGASFGGGFLKSPLSHIQLSAENVTGPLIDGFAITNTMLATWVTILVLTILAFFATRRMAMVPRGLQNLVESAIEAFLNLAQGIAGPERARRFFPLVMTIFLFIVTSNWLGILPGFGTIGRIETAEHVIEHETKAAHDKGKNPDLQDINLIRFNGDSVAVVPFGSEPITAAQYENEKLPEGQRAGLLVPFLRSANTALNTTLAIALVAMFLVQFWGIKSLGFFSYTSKFFNFRRLLKGNPMGIIDAIVGGLELVSEFARIMSFTFRLFGNIFAGEVLLVAMAFLIPLGGIIWIFLGLELFVGFIQAFIFAMLVLVFAVMATTAHESSEH